jgi:hypothetical protein
MRSSSEAARSVWFIGNIYSLATPYGAAATTLKARIRNPQTSAIHAALDSGFALARVPDWRGNVSAKETHELRHDLIACLIHQPMAGAFDRDAFDIVGDHAALLNQEIA